MSLIDLADVERLTAARVGRRIAQAARRGASPAELAELTKALTAELVDQDRAERKAKRREAQESRPPPECGEVAALLRRWIRSLDRRVLDDPFGTSDVLRVVDEEMSALRDRAAALLRSSGEYSWPELAALLRVSRATAFRRWGHLSSPTDGEEAPDLDDQEDATDSLTVRRDVELQADRR